MSYPELRRFEFHRSGHGNRRDRDACPRVLIIGFDDGYVQLHVAGDDWVRDAHVFDAAVDRDLVAGLEPQDALKLGMAYQRVKDIA